VSFNIENASDSGINMIVLRGCDAGRTSRLWSGFMNLPPSVVANRERKSPQRGLGADEASM